MCQLYKNQTRNTAFYDIFLCTSTPSTSIPCITSRERNFYIFQLILLVVYGCELLSLWLVGRGGGRFVVGLCDSGLLSPSLVGLAAVLWRTICCWFVWQWAVESLLCWVGCIVVTDDLLLVCVVVGCWVPPWLGWLQCCGGGFVIGLCGSGLLSPSLVWLAAAECSTRVQATTREQTH